MAGPAGQMPSAHTASSTRGPDRHHSPTRTPPRLSNALTALVEAPLVGLDVEDSQGESHEAVHLKNPKPE